VADMTVEELRRLVGEASDAQLAEIIGLKPTVSEVEQAVGWLDKEGDKLDRLGNPLAGKVALIFDILILDEEEP